MTAPTATPPVGSMTIPSARQQFLDVLKREHATTRKVVEAYPADQSEFKPHRARVTRVSSCGRSRSRNTLFSRR